jgi:hypothetical protein
MAGFATESSFGEHEDYNDEVEGLSYGADPEEPAPRDMRGDIAGDDGSDKGSHEVRPAALSQYLFLGSR